MSQHVNQQWLNNDHMTTNDSQHPGEQRVSPPPFPVLTQEAGATLLSVIWQPIANKQQWMVYVDNSLVHLWTLVLPKFSPEPTVRTELPELN